MDEVTQQAPAKKALVKTALTKEQRSKIMSEAASRRWAKARKAQAKAVETVSKPAPSKKRPSGPREFSSALKVAEKRLAQAITERAKAAALYAAASAEIPSLMQIIQSLKNPVGTLSFPGAPYYGMVPAPTLEQIVGDQPLQYQNPPLPIRRDIPAQPPQPPVMPVPQQLHPANTMGRAGGGAIGVDLPVEGDGGEEDENKFLNESAVAGGAWH